ncbi:hypothetical protein H4582DRAFT_536529 [Lactarius indigo]|nr:hypothetical protein H4582DRAFT_536529 [Lactarius indigo]
MIWAIMHQASSIILSSAALIPLLCMAGHCLMKQPTARGQASQLLLASPRTPLRSSSAILHSNVCLSRLHFIMIGRTMMRGQEFVWDS